MVVLVRIGSSKQTTRIPNKKRISMSISFLPILFCTGCFRRIGHEFAYKFHARQNKNTETYLCIFFLAILFGLVCLSIRTSHLFLLSFIIILFGTLFSSCSYRACSFRRDGTLLSCNRYNDRFNLQFPTDLSGLSQQSNLLNFSSITRRR